MLGAMQETAQAAGLRFESLRSSDVLLLYDLISIIYNLVRIASPLKHKEQWAMVRHKIFFDAHGIHNTSQVSRPLS